MKDIELIQLLLGGPSLTFVPDKLSDDVPNLTWMRGESAAGDGAATMQPTRLPPQKNSVVIDRRYRRARRATAVSRPYLLRD